MRRKWYFIAPAAIAGIALFVFLGGEIVRELWNWLLPPLLGLHEITFWQALGILALSRILFGGFGGGPRSRFRGRMTPDERERFRQGIGRRCGFGTSAPDAPQ